MRRIIPRLLRRRAISEMLHPYGLLHSVWLLVSQIARVVRITRRAELVVLRYRGGDNAGDGALHVEPLHPVVFAELSGCAVGGHVEEEGEEGGEAAKKKRKKVMLASLIE